MRADGKTPPADAKETSVALKGLAASVDETALATLFATHGKVVRVKLDGLGGAHAVFASTRAAQRAAAALNGAVVQGQRVTAQHVRAFAKTTRPCRGFQEGKCRKGDQCKYWHPTDATTSAVAAPPKIKKAATIPPVVVSSLPVQNAARSVATTGDDISGIPKASICRNFAKGKCLQGETCRFAHVLGAGELPPPPPASIPAQCSFYAAGKCTKGEACAFLHTDRPPQPPASKPTMCSFFAAGRCARGDQCAYLHETKPIVATTTAVAAPVVTKQPVVKQQPVAKLTAVKPIPAKKVKAAMVVATPTIDGDRTCIECETAGTATWVCAGCDNAKYCDECKPMVHRPKVMRSHQPEPLPVLTPHPLCGECETHPASVECEDCGVPYCASCDASVHQFKSLRGHLRTPLAASNSAVTPVKKEKKLKNEAGTKPVTTYIESVPQYDLPSESESSDEEGSDDDVTTKPQPLAQRNAKQTTAQDSRSESEDDDDEEKDSPAAAAMRAAITASKGYVESVPKYDLPSDSESSDEEDEVETVDDDDNDSVEEVKQSIVEAAVVAVKQNILSPVRSARPGSHSSESSDSDDDDFEDERPIVAAPAASKRAAQVPPTTTISSESESESDDEAAKPTVKTISAPAPKRKTPPSSSSSKSDSSDDDTPLPHTKQQRVAVKTTATSTRHAPATQDRKVGISTGSNHSLVKTIEAYAESSNTEVLHLDPNLNGFERLLAHDCAERLGLEHVSVGEGLERHITISRKGAATKRAAPSANGGGKKQKRA